LQSESDMPKDTFFVKQEGDKTHTQTSKMDDQQWEFWDYEVCWDAPDHDKSSASKGGGGGGSAGDQESELPLQYKPIANLTSVLSKEEDSRHLFAASMFRASRSNLKYLDYDDLSVDSDATARAANKKIGPEPTHEIGNNNKTRLSSSIITTTIDLSKSGIVTSSGQEPRSTPSESDPLRRGSQAEKVLSAKYFVNPTYSLAECQSSWPCVPIPQDQFEGEGSNSRENGRARAALHLSLPARAPCA